MAVFKTAATVPGERLFTPPVSLSPAPQPAAPTAVLGESWARALRAVIDGMKHVVDAERIEAAQAVGAPQTHRSPPARPSTPPWRAVWMPASALREAIATSPIQPTPVAVAPPTETGVDTRGQHAVLVGVKMELPWILP